MIMMDDNWKHRAKNMRCVTCMYYNVKKGTVGRCRRHAPTMSGFPVVYETDWCGDHKLNEEQVPQFTTTTTDYSPSKTDRVTYNTSTSNRS